MKKTISFILMIVLLLAALPAALADVTYFETYATAFQDATQIIFPTSSTTALRGNASNALFAEDATQTGGDQNFTGLRLFDSITYTFNDTANGVTRIIGNNPDPALPDLSLIEVTWNTGWHVEAVDVYLVNPTLFVNGVPVEQNGTYFIGTAYNKIGIDTYGLDAKYYSKVGNFGYSNIFFPDNVLSAQAVKLVDTTTLANTPIPTSNSYNALDDGYDLDAIKAWHVKDVPVDFDADFALTKFGDWNGNGLQDPPAIDQLDEGGLSDFTFQLWKHDGASFQPISTAISGISGDVLFENLTENGLYLVTEIQKPGYIQTSFLNGIQFTLLDGIITCDVAEANRLVGNTLETPPQYGSPETAWAGVITSDNFPTYTKKSGAAISGNVYRSMKSAWAMAIKFDGQPAVYDLVRAQYTVVGNVSMVDNKNGTMTVTYSALPGFKVDLIHCGVYAEINEIPNGNGQLNGTVNGLTVIVPYVSGTTVFVAAHSEVSQQIN